MTTAMKVFVDFDGTITRNDVGNAFFQRFGGEQCDEIVRAYREGTLTATECFRMEASAMGTIDLDDARDFVRTQEIDDTFHLLVKYCRDRNIKLFIVSDGLDFYIKEILARNGLADVPFFANVLEFHPPDRDNRSTPTLSFPHSDAECDRCGSCKRNIMLTKSGNDDVIVFVGEGYSDQCPAEFADIVFAKDTLQTYCQRQNISYFLYSSFKDVVQRLKEVGSTGRITQRRRAEIKRREAFLSE